MNTWHFKQSSFILGLTSILAQTILMRDLIAVFYGNELSYAVSLGAWLVWVGLGSLFLQTLFKKNKTPLFLKPILFLSLGMTIPIMIYGIHFIKAGFGLGPGEMVGLIPLLLSVFALTAPIGFVVGAIFAVLCLENKEEGRHTERIYLWESIGSACGGVVFAFFFVHVFSTVILAWLLALVCGGFVVWKRPVSKALYALSLGLFIFSIGAMVFSGFFDLEQILWQKQWPDSKLVAIEDSPYGKISISERPGQMNIYQDGLLSFTVPDALSAEEHVHFAMLTHPKPKRILLIGNGLGGELAEILKYSVSSLDYVTLDSEAFTLILKNLPLKYRDILNDKRLQVCMKDGRFFVKTAAGRYDVIILNIGDPHTAQMNRYYTEDFFAEVNRILAPGGVFTVSVSSSANYVSKENKTFLRSLSTTFKQVFPEVKSIPGDNHVFLVSNLKGVVDLSPEPFIKRYEESGISTQFIQPYEISLRLDQGRLLEIENILKVPGEVNRDMKPVVYLFNIVLWSTHFDTLLSQLIEKVVQVPAYALGIIPIAVFLFGRGLSFRKKKRVYVLAVALSGFSEIVFEVIVIFAFQALYGIAYQRIALILASFMAGLVFGVVSVGQREWGADALKLSFQRIQMGMVIYPLSLPAVFFIFRNAAALPVGLPAILSIAFACLPAIAGFMGGRQFILANRVMALEGVSQGPLLYAWDVFGAAIGAFLTATILIPVYGIVPACVLCAGINLAAWLLLKI